MSRQSETIAKAERAPITLTKSGIFGHKKATVNGCILLQYLLPICLFAWTRKCWLFIVIGVPIGVLILFLHWGWVQTATIGFISRINLWWLAALLIDCKNLWCVRYRENTCFIICLSIWRFGTLLKRTLAVLWKCYGHLSCWPVFYFSHVLSLILHTDVSSHCCLSTL